MNCPDCEALLHEAAVRCKCGWELNPKKKAANEDELLPLLKRPCAYCPKPCVGAVHGRPYCREHAWDAMDNIRPMKVPA